MTFEISGYGWSGVLSFLRKTDEEFDEECNDGVVFMSSRIPGYGSPSSFILGNSDYDENLREILINDEDASRDVVYFQQRDPLSNPLNRYDSLNGYARHRGWKSFSSEVGNIYREPTYNKIYEELMGYLQNSKFELARKKWDEGCEHLRNIKKTIDTGFDFPTICSQRDNFLFSSVNSSFVPRGSYLEIAPKDGEEKVLYTNPIYDEVAVLGRGFDSNEKLRMISLANLPSPSFHLMEDMINKMAQKDVSAIRLDCCGGNLPQNKNHIWGSIVEAGQAAKERFKEINFSYSTYLDPYQINGQDSHFGESISAIREVFRLYSWVGISSTKGPYMGLPGLLSKFDKHAVYAFCRFVSKNDLSELENDCKKNQDLHQNLISLVGKVYLYRPESI
jgi:hypothetical protein